MGLGGLGEAVLWICSSATPDAGAEIVVLAIGMAPWSESGSTGDTGTVGSCLISVTIEVISSGDSVEAPARDSRGDEEGRIVFVSVTGS